MTEQNNKAMIISAMAKNGGTITSNDLKTILKIRSPRKLNNLMRVIMHLVEEGVLTRLERGKYTIATATVKEHKNIEKIEKAIKLGKHIIIEGNKTDGTTIVRLGAPEKIIMSQAGKRSVRMQDSARNSWRTYRLDLIDNVKFAQ